MPNWCDNEVTIEGSEDVIGSIWKLITDANPQCKQTETTHGDNLTYEYGIEDAPIILGALMPEPDGYDGEESWARSKWGTKWDVEGYFYNRGDAIDMHFQSAWSPPDGVYQHLIENYDVSITAIYEEGGMEFCGVWRGEHEEMGVGCGGYDEWEYNLKSRTELRGEVPQEYHYLGEEKAGDLFYLENQHLEEGSSFTKVLGLQMGKGIINCFGDLFDDLFDDCPVEFMDGGFYINDCNMEEVLYWIEENKDTCNRVSGEDK